jgi:hypothetical protein
MNDIYEKEILGKLDIISANKPRIFEAGKAEGIEQGKQAEYDAFWDNFQNFGKRTSYTLAFSQTGTAGGGGWTNETYNPKYELVCTGSPNGASGTFAWNTKISNIKVPIDCRGVAMANTFLGCYGGLVTIPLLRVNEQTTFSTTFDYDSGLIDLTIDGTIGQNGLNLQWSTKLSKASIESIIGHLDQTEGRPASTITLSLRAVIAAFGDVGADGFGNDEFNNLCASARVANWTISLV